MSVEDKASIPKSSKVDTRKPLNCKALSLEYACFNVYCGVLNYRLEALVDESNLLSDIQYGFRTTRSMLDHLST